MVDKEIIQLKTCDLFYLLSIKCVDILLAHKLISQVYNVIWYRHQIQMAKTPETESLARWSLGDAREALDKTLCSMNICDLDKALVRWIANNSEYEER